MFANAMKNKTEAEAEKSVATVVDTYGTYLAYISKKLDERETSMFENVKERWMKLIARPFIDDMDRDTFVSFLISDLHDFAHYVGNLELRRRDGRRFLDNPYEAGRTDMVMEAMHG